MSVRIANTRQGFLIGVALVSLLLSAATFASNITYNVNRTIGTGTVTGFIQTDGTIGTLTLANVTDWSLVLFTPVQGSFSLFGPASDNNSVVWSTGGDVSATATQLLFDFSGSDFGVFAFQQGLFSGNHYYCDGTQTAQTNGFCDQGESVVPISVFQAGWQNAPRTGNLVIGTAGNSGVPEPGTIAMLGTGILAAAGAVRRKFMV